MIFEHEGILGRDVEWVQLNMLVGKIDILDTVTIKGTIRALWRNDSDLYPTFLIELPSGALTQRDSCIVRFVK